MHTSHPRRATARGALAILASLLLAGCLSSETTISLASDGSGSIDLRYEIDREAWETGVFDESDAARPVPVTRDDFRAAELTIPGIRLRSHRVDEEQAVVVVEARVDFASVEALERLLGRGSVEVRTDGESGSWRQMVAPARAADAAPDGADGNPVEALAIALDSYRLALILDPPSDVISTNGEILDDGDRASFELSLGDIVRAGEEIVWEVRW